MALAKECFVQDLLEEKAKFKVLVIKATNLVETVHYIFINYAWLGI